MTEGRDQLSDSLEDYLETILALEAGNKVARAKDIAEAMGVLQGSVTGALRSLSSKGMVNYEPYSFITLTPKGKRIAKEVAQRHTVVKDFLTKILQLKTSEAEANACRIEHAIDRVAMDRLVQFVRYLSNCPRTGPDWMVAFRRFCEEGTLDKDKCSVCVEKHQKPHP